MRNPEHYAIQLADSVEYALDVNTPNQVMRIRLRRSPLSEQRFHVKFTPLSRRSRPEVKAFIRSAKLSLTDAASPEPGNLVPWLAYGSDEESFFLAESEGTKRAGAERAKRLARLIDAANAEWRRSRGYVPMPRYRVDVIDSREWPRALKELAVVKDAGRSAAAGREPVVHPDAKVYVVRPGDVLSKIASRHGTTVEALVRANNLRDPDRLRVGQKLVIVKP